MEIGVISFIFLIIVGYVFIEITCNWLDKLDERDKKKRWQQRK